MEKNENKILVEVSYTGNNYSAYLPILPGCITTGETIDELKKNIKEIVPFHLEGMRESGEQVPEELNSEYEFTYNLSVEALSAELLSQT
ncbi:type II toxin-antitoxin system HicB family antitoxin [uncultured Bacteroides sp.]|uniref:type II toxin-antitoxin system HicB family antitoxin n=1 Tax=uncultured Bacteroides sp. TaxID=162156 RepID=UPI002AA842EF|nr:type II toxin-antitoxin system HicB family antitoxin [uncultured Bacteroides sp.]